MKCLNEAKETDKVIRHRLIPLTFGCVFVLFPCLIGLFEAVVAYKAVIREEINSKWLHLQVTIRPVIISTSDND